MNPAGLHPDAEIVSPGSIPAERTGAVTPRALSSKEVEGLISLHLAKDTQRNNRPNRGTDSIATHFLLLLRSESQG